MAKKRRVGGYRHRVSSLRGFVPTAFIPGITGRLYQQFAVTIAISVLLSPALAALNAHCLRAAKGILWEPLAEETPAEPRSRRGVIAEISGASPEEIAGQGSR
jgi:multidrug efflux pump subunit AcrB